MAIVKVSRDALSQFKLINPIGWYAFEVMEVAEPHLSKEKTCNVFDTKLKVLHDSENGNSNAGIESTEYLNDNPKAGFNILNFVAACEGVPPEELFGDSDELSLDLDATVGKKIWAKVSHDEYNGNLQNRLGTFMPYDSPPFEQADTLQKQDVSETQAPIDDDVPF